MVGRLVSMSDELSRLSKAFDEGDQGRVREAMLKIERAEEMVDSDFEKVASGIMDVEFLNVDPDLLLDVAKGFDLISDLIERASLLFQYLSESSTSEVAELLGTATSQVRQMMTGFEGCLKALMDDRETVERICATISEREKVVDGVRERFYGFASQKMSAAQDRAWLKDIFGMLDQVADLARDVTITLRSLAKRLERQRLLNVKGRGAE